MKRRRGRGAGRRDRKAGTEAGGGKGGGSISFCMGCAGGEHAAAHLKPMLAARRGRLVFTFFED